MKLLWLLIYFVVLIWSAINPKDYFTWFLEVSPALIGLVILIITYKRFHLTKISYILILIHCIILMVGGHYTYAEVPIFDWLKDYFGMARNNYDKIGHIASRRERLESCQPVHRRHRRKLSDCSADELSRYGTVRTLA